MASAALRPNGLVKRGKDGASVKSPDIDLDVPGIEVESRISTGAGDAFNVGFLWGIWQNWPLQRSVQFANGLAALIVGGANGIFDAPTAARVNAFLDGHG